LAKSWILVCMELKALLEERTERYELGKTGWLV
jgi:hypothetical protein